MMVFLYTAQEDFDFLQQDLPSLPPSFAAERKDLLQGLRGALGPMNKDREATLMHNNSIDLVRTFVDVLRDYCSLDKGIQFFV